MKFSISQTLAILLIFGLLFTLMIDPNISLVFANDLIKETITREKIVDQITKTIYIFKKIEVWIPSQQKHIERNIKVGTKTTTRTVPTGRFRTISVTTTLIGDSYPKPWYKDPNTIISFGSFFVSIFILYTQVRAN